MCIILIKTSKIVHYWYYNVSTFIIADFIAVYRK